MQFKFSEWAIEMKDNVFTNIYYNKKLIVDKMTLANEGLVEAPLKAKGLLETNNLSKIPNFLAKEKLIASYAHTFKNKFVWKQASKADLRTGRFNIKRQVKITKAGFSVDFNYKGKFHGYNNIFPAIKWSKNISSVFNLNKVKKKWHKEKITSQKKFTLSKKYPFAIRVLGETFLVKISQLTILKKKQEHHFCPLVEGKEKQIVNSWRVKPNVYFHIAFSIQTKPEKLVL